MSVICLVKYAKPELPINMEKNILSRKKFFARFSMATSISNLCYCIIHLANLVMVISGYCYPNCKDFLLYYLIFINGFSTVINPIVYMIWFKNVRKFFLFFVK